MFRTIITLLCLLSPVFCHCHIIDVQPVSGDATAVLRKAIDEAGTCKTGHVTIRLAPSVYHISRAEATPVKYHISNTASAAENPDHTKHIGFLFRGMKDVTLDGNGALIVTHGEMTSLVLDSCENIVLQNFTLTAADPSVPEFIISGVDSCSFTASVLPPSRFEFIDNKFFFIGEGWRLPDDGTHPGAQYIAQVFLPEKNITKRVPNPIKNHRHAALCADSSVQFFFDRVPDVRPGEIYQVRHAVRNEACGFISRSSNVTVKNIRFNFMGNFGIVSQFSENLYFDSIVCMPDSTADRTAAGFADFLQFSSCKGLVSIKNSVFQGSHDDPINIHGTHLRITELTDSNKMIVRYMHPQTFGFAPCFAGDSIEIVDAETLLPRFATIVESCSFLDDYNYQITTTEKLPDESLSGELVIENTTWTPEVEIEKNIFARTPTRAILLTTRRRSVIRYNVFFRIPMPAILVADDARSWYESGPVHDLLITGNRFFECSAPAILIKPEISISNGPVHSGIFINNNTFINQPSPAITYTDSSVTVSDNKFSQTED